MTPPRDIAEPVVASVDVTEASSTAFTVAVRQLCEFSAKLGDLDLRFTPSPTAQQGREGHQLVAQRRGADYESELSLAGSYEDLRVRGRADGFDPVACRLEEVKTFRGALDAIGDNQQALHWAQLKVYGWLLCESRGFDVLTLCLVYLDVTDQSEHPQSVQFEAADLSSFFVDLCTRYLAWARLQAVHRVQRDAALEQLAFPQEPFRPGQRELASVVYRACTQGRPLLAQAPTGIGKTIGTIYPALRAMPRRGVDKVFFLTAKTPGRQVALDTLLRVRGSASTGAQLPLRVLELVARDKACEYRDKACHGDSCPLAKGFYDRLPAARAAAAEVAWLDQRGLRDVALAHGICPYYLGQEMVRWSDVVVGDYNYYFDRSALLHAHVADGGWRVSVQVDEAHNLEARACSMYSADLTHEEATAVLPHVGAAVQARLNDWLDQWQLLLDGPPPDAANSGWSVLDEVPQAWLRALQRLNSAISEHLQQQSAQSGGGVLLPFYFRTLAFATLAEAFGEHSLCEFDTAQAGRITLRNVIPAPFIAPRIKAADALVLFSATLNPPDYYTNLLGLPEDTPWHDVPSPFAPEQLQVRIQPISTRLARRAASLDVLVRSIAEQYQAQPGNYLAFFSSFDYLELALNALHSSRPEIRLWAQSRQMDEPARRQFLQRFDAARQGIGFAVLGGAFAEGVDLPGRRLIGAFVATLGLPPFDPVNAAICERLEQTFGRGHDYTYVVPGLQKVVQAAGRVIRSASDTGTLLLLDARYLEARYRALLPDWWRITSAATAAAYPFAQTPG